MKAIRAFLLPIAFYSARAVILFDTGDPNVNTSAPTGDLAGSGWQYEGYWNGFIGTPIAPSFFIAAAHIGGSIGDSFVYQGVTYSTVKSISLSGSDLLIWQVNGTFPSFAPLYTNQDEVGKGLVDFGHGTQRGDAMYLNGSQTGWAWGPADGRQRWGQNTVSDVVSYSGHDLLYSTFDEAGQPGNGPNECHLSSGDSSGGVFINDGSAWKLAGINYAVDDLYSAPDPNTAFTAAIFDARGYYTTDDHVNFTLISGPDPVPTGFYCSRISSEIAWIESVIDPNGDWNGDGVPNLLGYALVLNEPPRPGRGAIQGGAAGGFLSITYRKITDAANLQYQVQESTDLVSWEPVTPQEQVIDTQGNVQTIKASVPIADNARLFLRLRITQS